MVTRSILPEGPIKNPRWRPFSKMDTNNQFTSSGCIYLDELIYCGDKIDVLEMHISPINTHVLSEQHCKHYRVKKHNVLDKQEHFHHTQNALIIF